MAINKIKLARVLEGLSQLELAARSGIHVTIVSQIEHGWRNPTPDQAEKLERALPALKRAEVLTGEK